MKGIWSGDVDLNDGRLQVQLKLMPTRSGFSP